VFTWREPPGPPGQVHVQFGADAATEIAVSWAAPAPAGRSRLRVGLPGDGFGREVPAEERVYTDALTAPLGQPVEQVGDGGQDRDDRHPHELVPVEERQSPERRDEVVVLTAYPLTAPRVKPRMKRPRKTL
jgi:hypothetical protein